MNTSPKQSRYISFSAIRGGVAHRCDLASLGYGYETDPVGYNWENRSRQSFSLFQFTISGEGRFRAGKSPECRLTPGLGFLVNCPSHTRYWLPTGATWEFFYMILAGDVARYLVKQLIDGRGHIIELPLSSPPVELLRRAYAEAAAGTIPDRHRRSARAYELLMELYHQRAAPEATTQMETAIHLIESLHGDASLTAEAVAGKVGLSRFHFSRLFRKQTGMSPYAYLTQFRMNRAMDYLVSTRMPAKEISQQVGFNDYSQFCKMFRLCTGQTPGSARKSVK